MVRKLSPKENLLVTTYIAQGQKDQRGALVKAGYSRKSLSKFNDPRIKAEIENRVKRIMKRRGVDTEDLVTELSAPAFLDLSNIWAIGADGQPYPDWSKLTPDQLRCVKSIRSEIYVEGRGKDAPRVKRITVEFFDKLRSVEMLGKHVGMFGADNKQKSGFDGAELVAALHRGRARATGRLDDEGGGDA